MALRAILLAIVCLAAARAAVAQVTLPPRQARIHHQICATCHARPGIGVPLVGDELAWAARRSRGLDALVESTINGVGGMPPLGTCSYCTQEDLELLVAYLAGIERR
jgi:cytochrome c5